MKRWTPLLIFIITFPLFLYLTFPFDRVIGRILCEKGITYSSLSVNRFPFEVELENVRVPSLPVEIERVIVRPSLLSILSKEKSFEAVSFLCGGRVNLKGSYPGEIRFKISEIEAEKCRKESPRVGGRLSGSGSLKVSGNDLTGGRGEFLLKDSKLEGIEFGIFTFPALKLGNVRGTYSVKRKNRLEINAEGKGRDADVTAKGYLDYYPKNPKNSYLKLKVTVKVKIPPLSGKKFKFTVRGNLGNLRIWK